VVFTGYYYIEVAYVVMISERLLKLSGFKQLICVVLFLQLE